MRAQRYPADEWNWANDHPQPRFITLVNVLTVERQGDLTTVVMLGGETIYVDTMPETLIGGVAPAGP